MLTPSRRPRNGQHALARLQLPKDDDYETARVTLMCMVVDMKHTKPWMCEFCGAHSYPRLS